MLFKLFSFQTEFKIGVSLSESTDFEILTFQLLKYSISNYTYDILLDNSWNPDKN